MSKNYKLENGNYIKISKEEIEINITINTTKKVVYFSEMSGSGCKYPYKNMDDLKNRIQFYLEFYHPEIFNSKGKETKNE